MKKEGLDSASLQRLKKILSTAALCAMLTSNLAGAATYDVSTVAAKGIGSGLGTSDFNSIVDTLKGWVVNDQDTNDGADDTATFAGDICNGSGDCLSDAMNSAAAGKFVDGATASDAVFSGGNVGIGTDSPESKLHVRGATGVSTVTLEAESDVVRLRLKGGGAIGSWDAGGSPISIGTTDDDVLLAQQGSGNVGIGTTTPTEKLEVAGNVKAIDADSGFVVETTDSSSDSFVRGLQIVRNDVDSGYFGSLHNGQSGLNYSFIAPSANDYLDPTIAFKPNGNVGIGTDNPSAKLEISVESGAAGLRIVNENESILGGGLYLTQSDLNIASINSVGRDLQVVSGWGNSLTLGHTEYDNHGGKVLIPGGNVGIGTAAPTEKLDVDGNVKATAFIGDGSQLTNIAGGKFVDGTTATDAVFTGGNVGIGTDAPVADLDVAGNGQFWIREGSGGGLATTAGKGLKIEHNGGGAVIQSYDYENSSAMPLSINPSGTNTILNHLSGNVGIGTDAPAQKLHVNEGAIFISEDTNPWNLKLDSNNISFNRDGHSYINQLGTGHIRFRMGANSDISMAIEAGGNVGIGTTTPTEKLEVAGTAKVEDVIMSVKTDKGNCEAANLGKIVYEQAPSEDGVFYGCMKRADNSYSWVNLQVFGQ